MLLLFIIRNFSLIVCMFMILINLILLNLKLNIKKTAFFVIHIIFLIICNSFFPSLIYCEGWIEEADANERILQAALKESDEPELVSENSKKFYYIMAISSIFLIVGLGLYFYFNGGGTDLPPHSYSNILNLNTFEETEVKISQDSLTKKLDYSTTPPTTPTSEKALDKYTGEISPVYEEETRILTEL